MRGLSLKNTETDQSKKTPLYRKLYKHKSQLIQTFEL